MGAFFKDVTAFLRGVSRLGAGSGYRQLCFPTWNAFIPAGHCHQSQRPHATPAASPAGVVVNGPEPASSAARCDASDVVPKKDVLQLFKLFRAPTTCRKLRQASRKKAELLPTAIHQSRQPDFHLSMLSNCLTHWHLCASFNRLGSPFSPLCHCLEPLPVLQCLVASFSIKPALRVPPQYSFHMV